MNQPLPHLISGLFHYETLLSTEKTARADFTCAGMSPKGRWVYCVGEDGEMLCFDSSTAEMERSLRVSDKEVIGVAHHPHR